MLSLVGSEMCIRDRNKNNKMPYLNIPQRYKNQVQRKG
jgi:hypothetical protein